MLTDPPQAALDRLLDRITRASAPLEAKIASIVGRLDHEFPQLAALARRDLVFNEEAEWILAILDGSRRGSRRLRSDAERTDALRNLAKRLGPVSPGERKRVLLKALRRSGYLGDNRARVLDQRLLAALAEAGQAVVHMTPADARLWPTLRERTVRLLSEDLLGPDWRRRGHEAPMSVANK